MKKQQIIGWVSSILILLISETLPAQVSFSYGEKHCGQYQLEIQLASKTEDDLTKVVVDFNEIKTAKVELMIKLSDLQLGLDQLDCQKVKSKSHNKDHYIELKDMATIQKKSVIQWENWSSIRIGNKNKDPKESRLFGVINRETIKNRTEEALTIVFQINDETGKVQDVVGTKITLVVIPLKMVEDEMKRDSTDVKESIDISGKEVESGAASSKLIKTKEAQILWDKIVEEVEGKNFDLLRNLTYRYRENYDISFSNYETAWFYSIRYAKNKSEQKILCHKYSEKFTNGGLESNILEICTALENKKNPKKEQDEIGYWINEVMPENTPEAYQKYLKKYSETGTFITDAEKKIEEFLIEEKGRSQYDSISFMMKYSYSGNEMLIPTIEVLEGGNYILDTIRPTLLGVNIRLQADKSARLRLSVPDSPWKVTEVEIDVKTPSLSAEIIRDDANKTIQYNNIKDGKLPYRIELINFDEGRVVRHFDLTTATKNWVLNYDTLQRLTTGNYKLRLRDQSGINQNQFTSDSFFVEIIPPKPWWMYALPASILSLLILALFYKWNSKRKKGKVTSASKIETKGEEKEILETENTADLVKDASIRKRITVHGKRDVEVDETLVTIDNLLANGVDYLPINLNELWEKSIISTVFIHPKCVEQIDDFVFKNANIHLLPNGAMPEIGGFLLGKYVENEGQFQLTLEEFIDIESEDNNVYQISFGAKAWSKLEKKMEEGKNESYKLIGWFHTHPGHGLFLSRPDLNIHQNFFNSPFQFAMEIDNVQSERNPTYDVGFFTQQPSGEINNVKVLKDSWFQWAKLYS